MLDRNALLPDRPATMMPLLLRLLLCASLVLGGTGDLAAQPHAHGLQPAAAAGHDPATGDCAMPAPPPACDHGDPAGTPPSGEGSDCCRSSACTCACPQPVPAAAAMFPQAPAPQARPLIAAAADGHRPPPMPRRIRPPIA